MTYFEQVVLMIIPILLCLIIIEKLYGYMRCGHAIHGMDIITGLGSGMTSILKDILGLTIVVISYQWLYEHIRVLDLGHGVGAYVIAFLMIDFAGYWWHRLMHRVNLFWNEHLIHHSSEEFDLASALRQPISNIITWIPVFIFPVALLGVSPEVIAILTPIHVFAQYWYHTRYIGKLGILESIIVTPSHHRVHHAQNPEYLDKNFGLIFIFWDRLFGTFQHELSDVPPVYGVTRPVSTWNPIKINFSHLTLLLKDAYRASKWSDKIKVWFMPTGWRPEGLEEKYPIEQIVDVYNFQKYNTTLSKGAYLYVCLQFLSTIVLFLLFMMGVGGFYFEGAVAYGLMLMMSIYGYSELMDQKRSFIAWVMLRDIGAVSMLMKTQHWAHISEMIPGQTQTLLMLFIVSSMTGFILFFSNPFLRNNDYVKMSV